MPSLLDLALLVLLHTSVVVSFTLVGQRVAGCLPRRGAGCSSALSAETIKVMSEPETKPRPTDKDLDARIREWLKLEYGLMIGHDPIREVLENSEALKQYRDGINSQMERLYNVGVQQSSSETTQREKGGTRDMLESYLDAAVEREALPSPSKQEETDTDSADESEDEKDELSEEEKALFEDFENNKDEIIRRIIENHKKREAEEEEKKRRASLLTRAIVESIHGEALPSSRTETPEEREEKQKILAEEMEKYEKANEKIQELIEKKRAEQDAVESEKQLKNPTALKSLFAQAGLSQPELALFDDPSRNADRIGDILVNRGLIRKTDVTYLREKPAGFLNAMESSLSSPLAPQRTDEESSSSTGGRFGVAEMMRKMTEGTGGLEDPMASLKGLSSTELRGMVKAVEAMNKKRTGSQETALTAEEKQTLLKGQNVILEMENRNRALVGHDGSRYAEGEAAEFFNKAVGQQQPMNKRYWEDRFKVDDSLVDWYAPWSFFKPFLQSQISSSDRILNLGSGTSRLPFEMYDDGLRDVTSVDWAGSAVANLREHAMDRGMGELQFRKADARYMGDKVSSESFDFVIDKGLLDSVLGSGAPTAAEDAEKIANEVFRVLKPGGSFFCISHGRPSQRLATLRANNIDLKLGNIEPVTDAGRRGDFLDWSLEVVPISKEEGIILKKKTYSIMEEVKEKWEHVRRKIGDRDPGALEIVESQFGEIRKIHDQLMDELPLLHKYEKEDQVAFQKEWYQTEQALKEITEIVDNFLPMPAIDWDVREASFVVYKMRKVANPELPSSLASRLRPS